MTNLARINPTDKFEKYDIQKLNEAYTLIQKVYEYYYDFPPMKKLDNRLLTILNKLETVIKLGKQD